MDTITETVGRNRLVRATEQLTGAALATKLGSTQSFIWRVLKGTRLPGRQLAAKIAEVFPEIPATTWDQKPREPGSTEAEGEDPTTILDANGDGHVIIKKDGVIVGKLAQKNGMGG